MDRYGVSGLQPGEAGAGRARTETASLHYTIVGPPFPRGTPPRLSADSYTKSRIPVPRVSNGNQVGGQI